VTATRDRRSDPEVGAEPAWDDRPIIGQFRGLPWWAAVLLAFGLTAIAAFVDMQRQDTLGRIYQVAFVLGCVGAVCLVRRRSLFGPMVQPPLVFAITAVAAEALLSQKAGGGLKSLLLSVALPLTSNFPTMGITTAVVVLIGLYRWWRERDPDPEVRPNRAPKQRAADLGLDDEPGQGSGGRGPRERAGKDRAAAPPRRGRPEMEELPPLDERAGRRGGEGRGAEGRGSRPSREPAGREGARDTGRDARRRDAAAGRPERGRGEPPANAAGRRGRGGEPSRRREPGADGGRSRDERGRRDTGRDSGRDAGRDTGKDGRGGSSGRQPRRRPPESR
jgi:hypothetical protein